MGDRPVSQPEAESMYVSTDPSLVWGTQERPEQPGGMICRQVGNTIICTNDIYGAPERPNEAFRAVYALQRDLGMQSYSQVIARVSDQQVPPYYPPGTLTVPGAGRNDLPDYYSFHQGAKPEPAAQQAPREIPAYDPYSYHQGDRTAPPLVPPVNPNKSDAPLPLPPLPDKTRTPDGSRPQDRTADPRTESPRPCNPNPNPNPCRPCQPCRPRWYPGMIAGRVLGRVFGGGRRCR